MIPDPPDLFRRVRPLNWLLPALLLPAGTQAAIDTAFAVQASATVQSAPAQITLTWTPGPVTTNTYAIARKEPGATSWTPLINLGGSATSFTDTNVATGRIYEYQVVRQALGVTGYGYLATAIDLPVVDRRGKVILVIDSSIVLPLAVEIDQLASDLVGDGWTVARREVGRGDSPAMVRDAIRAAYREDSAGAQAVLLLGHVPVARSGNLDLDGHGGRPFPADSFYGDMDGTWTDANGDGVFDENQIPSDIELMVGRIDFADMPGKKAATPFPNETELLRRYLKKDREYRHGLRRVTARALVGDRIGDASGEAFSASGFRNFSALLGPNRITAANVEDNSPAGERWLNRLTGSDWQWVQGSAAGDITILSWLGQHGIFNDVWSTDLVDQKARGTFYLLFGSWLVDWSQPDNIMRAALAAPDYGLTAAWAGRPHLFFQHMAVGETTGHGIRLSQNNASLYAQAANRHTRGIHVALLGDPTLRLQVVAPAAALTVAPGGGAPALSWNASPEAADGYHVYRATDAGGPFDRVTASPVRATNFTDSAAPAGNLTYMVRAVRRDVSGSASYFNLSQGIFAQVSVTNPPPPPPPPADPTPPPPPNPAPTPNPDPIPAPNPISVGGNAGGGGASGGGGATSLWLPSSLALLVFLRFRRGFRHVTRVWEGLYAPTQCSRSWKSRGIKPLPPSRTWHGRF